MAEQFVRLLNAERHKVVDAILLGPPIGVDLHWDENSGRSKLCLAWVFKTRGLDVPTDTCRWCELERDVVGYHYVAAMAPGDNDQTKGKWVPAIIQLPMKFVHDSGNRLRRGRRIRIKELAPRRKALWSLVDMVDEARMPESFDLIDALLRIKGQRLPSKAVAGEKPDILPMKRQA